MRFIITGVFVAVLAVACGDDAPAETATPTAAVNTATETPSSVATAVATATEPPPRETPMPFEGSVDPVEVAGGGPAATVVDVRAAVHDGFDRIVFEFAGPNIPGYHVQYVDAHAACGSGQPVTLPGAAMLSIEIQPATAHNDSGESTVDVREIDLGGTAITEAEGTCDLEALVAWVVGVTGQRPFKVFELSGPPRLVIDIANVR